MNSSPKVVQLSSVAPRRGQHGAMKPRPEGTLKAAVLHAFESFGPNYGARVGEILGLGSSQVQRYTDPEHRNAYPRIDHLRTLHNAGASLEVLHFLAADAGCVLLAVDASAAGPFSRQMAKVGENTANLFREYGDALSDADTPGEIDPEEARRMLTVADRLMSDLAALTNRLRIARGPEDAA